MAVPERLCLQWLPDDQLPHCGRLSWGHSECLSWRAGGDLQPLRGRLAVGE